jgi:hypothetical protein
MTCATSSASIGDVRPAPKGSRIVESLAIDSSLPVVPSLQVVTYFKFLTFQKLSACDFFLAAAKTFR